MSVEGSLSAKKESCLFTTHRELSSVVRFRPVALKTKTQSIQQKVTTYCDLISGQFSRSGFSFTGMSPFVSTKGQDFSSEINNQLAIK